MPPPPQSAIVTQMIDPAKEISVSATLPGDGVAAVAAVVASSTPDPSETMPSMTNAMIGQVLGSYRVLDILGEGGMGRVYLAEHTKIGRRVALKMLHSHLAHSPEVVRRFFDEARAVNRILHEHIVEITDFVENEDGNNYFIMEHLRGAPLSDVMEEDNGTSPIARSLGIGVQVASALSAVHAANIVHRDLKPENIFLTHRGGQKDFVKLLDFGIAKLVGDDGSDMKLQTTQAGVIMGTPDYMSPEQASAAKIDHLTDIYSLGIILYELCTGRLPFIADNFGDLIVLHKTKKPLRPSKVPDLAQTIPAPLEELILQCLEKEPAKRPQSAKEIEDRLHEIAWGFAVELEQFELTGASGRGSGRRGIIVGVVGAAVAVGALAFALTKSDEPQRQAVVPTEISVVDPEPPPAAPSPPVEAPAKGQVALSFLSEPSGAMVYSLGEESELLGVTPFTGSFEQSDTPMRVEFRRAGFESEEQKIALDKRGSLRAVLKAETLAKAPTKSRKTTRNKRKNPKGKGKGKKLDEGAVLDPFAN